LNYYEIKILLNNFLIRLSEHWPLLTEDVPGAEALALGPAVRVEGPVDPVGGRVGDAEEEANGEQAAEGKPPRRTAPSLSHSDRRPELFLWALS